MVEEIPTVISRPEVEIASDLLESLKTMTYEEGQVVVHCLYFGLGFDAIRIWPTTYLFDLQSDHRSELVHVENICMAPDWMLCSLGLNRFTLIFSGLARSCRTFDLVEQCPGDGAFIVKNILRTDSDVYYIRINSGVSFGT